MKNIKKFIVIIAMTMIFSVSAFAASGFEFILNVPFGINVGIPNKETKDAAKAAGGSMGNHIGFDVGVELKGIKIPLSLVSLLLNSHYHQEILFVQQ